MQVTKRQDPLTRALDELDRLATGADREKLARLRERLASARLRVLIVGEAKRGKSTLVNALLGREVLPTGVTPLTSLATTVAHGTQDRADAVFLDGRSERLPLAALGDLVTERGNPANSRQVANVTVRVSAPILARGVELVDTPGAGSVHAHNTSAAATALDTMDAAVFVLTADPPVSATERELLTSVARLSVRTFVVLNKADYLDEAGLNEALEFTARVVRDATGRDARIYPLSARAALGGRGDPGFRAFAADFDGYLDQGGAADLNLAAAGHLRRMAAAMLDEVTLVRRAAQMRGGEAAERVAAFTGRLAAVSSRRRDAADLVAGESARMLAALNEAAEQEERHLGGGLNALIDALLDGELRGASAAGIERAGRDRLVQRTRESAERWRQDQRQRLEQGLDRLGARLTGDLAAELDAVRGAAADLLGLELTLPGASQRLAPDLSFFYATAQETGQTELLAGAVRRRLPGGLGRSRARDHLRRTAADLAGIQIGRARADLQYRLAEATRRLLRTIQERYADSTDHLARALDAAAALRADTDADTARSDSVLAGRENTLRAVLARLDG